MDDLQLMVKNLRDGLYHVIPKAELPRIFPGEMGWEKMQDALHGNKAMSVRAWRRVVVHSYKTMNDMRIRLRFSRRPAGEKTAVDGGGNDSGADACSTDCDEGRQGTAAGTEQGSVGEDGESVGEGVHDDDRMRYKEQARQTVSIALTVLAK